MSDIPFPHDEYKAALREERAIREEIFLGLPAKICGIRIKQITPFLFARLCAMETPFLSGKDASLGEVVRFLWALSSEFSTSEDDRHSFIINTTKSLAGLWKQAEEEIDAFVRNTFLDAPRGDGGDSVPYVTGSAWMIYKMGCEPFRWDKERTLHTPMREIYQLIRCQRLEQGGILYNDISDKIKARWLDEVNANLRAGGNN